MKKTISLLALMAVMIVSLGFSPVSASADENPQTGIALDKAAALATDVVEKYYRNKDLGENHDLSAVVNEPVLELLQTKIDLGQMLKQILELDYRDYQITIHPFHEDQWRMGENESFIVLRVERTWFYNSEQTTTSELLNITLSDDTNKGILLTECYEPFENITLGPVDEMFQQAGESKINLTSEVETYKENFKQQLLEKKEQMVFDAQANKSNDEIDLMAKTSLARSDIKDWARNNYNKNDPKSSNSSVPYYDFSELNNAWDCTNFASHAILAGGATMNDKGKKGITGTDQWYFRSSANRSSSWAGVNQLYDFLTRKNPGNSNKGPYGTLKALTYANAYTGDIVQGHNGDIWRHTTVVTKFENSKVYVTGRTGDGVYNDNDLATSIYGKQRLIYLEGNYN
jgi:hypothetical protein